MTNEDNSKENIKVNDENLNRDKNKHLNRDKNKHLFNNLINKFILFYDKNYKKLILIPLIILFVSIIFLGFKYIKTGELFDKDVSLKGGVSITITADENECKLIQDLIRNSFPRRDIYFRTINSFGNVVGITISSSDTTSDEIITVIENNLGNLEYNVEEMGSSLGSSFFRETFIAIIFAFLFMGLVILFYFMKWVPSLLIILSAFSNVIVALAAVNLFSMKLSTAGIAAFLMMIGYSVDTNILLTTRVLKKKEGSILEKILNAMSTGLLMTGTTILSLILGILLTTSEAIRQILLILLFGLIMDTLNTWIQNAGLLRWYLERRHHD